MCPKFLDFYGIIDAGSRWCNLYILCYKSACELSVFEQICWEHLLANIINGSYLNLIQKYCLKME